METLDSIWIRGRVKGPKTQRHVKLLDTLGVEAPASEAAFLEDGDLPLRNHSHE
jgi:hypothetical protein